MCQARELGAHDHRPLFQERHLILRELPDSRLVDPTLFPQINGNICECSNAPLCKR